ncbi:MFS transporter [Streptomyces sp. NPDC052676]|uniref:MFS transporter n=1 Tax=Streptomyces sp. NPDC052676 TaxID=3154953 RepID=UPI00341DCCDB
MLALLLAAMDATVMGTVLPDVLADVGGGSGGGYAWLVSGFMLAQVAGTPLAGWIADRLDDRVLAVGATAGFLAASVAAGLAGSFAVLVAARVLHGLTAGAIVVSSYVIVGRAFGPERRAKAQGMLSMVWGVAAVLGPVVGAALTEAAGWRWVFYVNVPLCALVMIAVAVGLPGRAKDPAAKATRPRFPLTEYTLLTGGSALLLVAVQAGSLGLGTAGGITAALLALLALALLRPRGGSLVPRQMLSRTPVAGAALATVGACVVMYATVTVLPVRLAEQGTSTTGVAFVVGLSALGWVAGSMVTGGLVTRHGYRPPMTAGALALLATATLGATGHLPWLAGLTAGLGTGAVTATTLALIQDHSPPDQLGVATSAATTLRNIGSALGANGIAALSATLTPTSATTDPAFWPLAAATVCMVLLPSLTAPRHRTPAD